VTQSGWDVRAELEFSEKLDKAKESLRSQNRWQANAITGGTVSLHWFHWIIRDGSFGSCLADKR